MVCGEQGIGKSSLVEHLLLSLNEDGARALFQHRVAKVVPFGNLTMHQTKKITEYPLLTDDLRVKLIDCPGFSFSNDTTNKDVEQCVKRIRSFINVKIIEYSNQHLEIKRDFKDPVLRSKRLK